MIDLGRPLNLRPQIYQHQNTIDLYHSYTSDPGEEEIIIIIILFFYLFFFLPPALLFFMHTLSA